MANEKAKTGHKGEELAINLLRTKGYRILAQNWRHKRLEVDIIAQIGAELVFVEVKTRRNNDFGFPEQWVDQKKIQNLTDAAHAYLQLHESNNELRFDIIAITENPPGIEHFEDAFWPSW